MTDTRGERAILCCRMIAKAIDLPPGADFPELVEAVKKLKAKSQSVPVKKLKRSTVESA